MVGPGSSYKRGEITPASRVITPGTHLFSAIYMDPITSFTNGSRAHLETIHFLEIGGKVLKVREPNGCFRSSQVDIGWQALNI